MLRKPVALITGASGEIGHELITRLAKGNDRSVITVDLKPVNADLAPLVRHQFAGSILDTNLLERILSEYEVDLVFHLAALLSTRSEFTPVTAHHVNVEGTLNMLEFAQKQGESHGRPVIFLYPSSIAAYGMPDRETKTRAGRVKEGQYNEPATMYGCNKLYCEQLGRYYARHYKQLSAEPLSGRVDFRCIRFPGLISAATVPSGGTSDFAPEMIHAAAQGQAYGCFVRPDTRIPFMAMPDAVSALLALATAPREGLSRTTYNIGAFNPSAGEIQQIVERAFPGAKITTAVDGKRQAIVDSWPEDVDDSAARHDWRFEHRFGLESAFEDYLIPAIRKRYGR